MDRAVLAIGIDPAQVARHAPETAASAPTVDAESIRAGAAASGARLRELGFDVDVCFTDYGTTAETVVRERLAGRSYDFVMIGVGLRTDHALTHLFEVLVNATRELQPGAVLVFNTDPASTAAAVERWFPRPTPVQVPSLP